MKKVFVILLASMLLLSLAACDQNQEQPQITIGTQPAAQTTAPQQTEQPEQTTEPQPQQEGVYAFTYEETVLCPGEPFDASKLPAASSTYKVPSCALEGTDNVYNYAAFEVTAFDDGKGEFVYSVYFLDPNLTTAEGLAIGDTAAKAEELYGKDYAAEGTSMVYTKGNTQLVLILQSGNIISIEYRLVIE